MGRRRGHDDSPTDPGESRLPAGELIDTLEQAFGKIGIKKGDVLRLVGMPELNKVPAWRVFDFIFWTQASETIFSDPCMKVEAVGGGAVHTISLSDIKNGHIRFKKK